MNFPQDGIKECETVMAKGDPCAALFGSMKKACEGMGKTVDGGSGGTASALGGLLGYNSSFDFRHFMIRVAEFGIGAMLVIISVDALIKAEVMPSPIVRSGKSLGKKVFK